MSNDDFERRAGLLWHTDYKRHKGYRRETKVNALEADMTSKYQQLNDIIGLSPLNLLKEKEVLKHRELQTKTYLNNVRKLLEEESYYSRQLISHGNHQLRTDFQQQTSKKIQRQLQENKEEVFVLEKSPKDISNIFIMFIFIVFIGELLSSPSFNLANSEIVEFLGENSREFGKIRL